MISRSANCWWRLPSPWRLSIVARFVWVFPATYLPRWLIPSVRRRDPSPPWQQTFVVSFTGVRGVVSLAAALAIPLTIENGAPFPHRDAILFATFGVIIFTLVGQGLTLPLVIRWLGIGHHGKAEHRREQEAELAARNEAIGASRRHLEKIASERKLEPRDRRVPQRPSRSSRAAHSERSGRELRDACG